MSEKQRVGKREINVSADDRYARCPRQWYFTDKNWGLGYGTKVVDVPQYSGTLFHSFFQGWYGSECQAEPITLVDEAISATYDELLERGERVSPEKSLKMLDAESLCRPMALGYATWARNYEGPLNDSQLQYHALEHEVVVELGEYAFRMRIDGLAYEPEFGEWWVVETKTTSDPDNLERSLRWDLQPRAYIWALQELKGIKISGVIYNLVRRCNPYDIPTLIKKSEAGMPSRAKTVLDNTSYRIYEDFLLTCARQTGRDLEAVLNDYAEQLNYLREKEETGKGLFRRVIMRYPTAVIDGVPAALINRIERMIEDAGPHAPANLNRHDCGRFCPVREACWAMDMGGDWLQILRSTFESYEGAGLDDVEAMTNVY